MLKALKLMIGYGVEKLGYTIVPNWALDTYPTARYMRSLFALLNIDLVLDVGANQGQYHDFLRDDVGYRGQVVSFEPIPQLVAKLKLKAARSSSWQVDARAVGSSIGSLAFNVMENSVMSSFLTPEQHGLGGSQNFGNQVHDTIDVDITTIDSELPSLIGKYAAKNIFLKIDTQGFDLEVLKGAAAVLPGIAALQTEASVTPLYTGMPAYHDVIDFLDKHGFTVSGIYPVNTVFFPRLIEFDCYMINKTRVP